LTVASVPAPARAVSLDEYQRQVEATCALVGAEVLLVDDIYLPWLQELCVQVVPFSACAANAGGRVDDTAGYFVQFTSGSTMAPRGVHLTLDAMAANVLAILDVLQPAPGDSACSWLPLSHDMGLVGMCLTPWVANAPERAGSSELALIRTEAFVGRPTLWLSACSELGATYTAAPNFAFDIARRALATTGPIDLSRLRVCITGGEPVQSRTLLAFEEATSPVGFSGTAFCPAYGMAEATLAVTMVQPGQRWNAVTVDPVALAGGRWEECANGRPIVAAGSPLPGMEVRIAAAEGNVGPIQIRGPSVAGSYVGADLPFTPDGWLPTHDVGIIVNGELHVVGRVDDLLIVAGRNLYAHDIETVVAAITGVRPGNAVAIDAATGRYVVVAETLPGADRARLAASIREALATALATGPASVIFVRPRTLPKTSSGKIQRHRVRALYEANELATENVFSFTATTLCKDTSRVART